jgi:transcriptional antiterminator RfaH
MDSKILGDNTPTISQWYLLKTKPRSEIMAQNALADYEIKTYLPRLVSRKKGKAELEATPLFPGYLFFQLDYESRLWGYIQWARGVSYVLKGESGPMSLPAELIDEIRLREGRNAQKVQDSFIRPYESNEPLKIVAGPFAGIDAVFESHLSASGRVQVLIQIVGRLTRVVLDSASLMRVN